MEKVLQILDQSIPYVSGYSIRSKYIANSLKRLGRDVEVFTSPIYQYASEKEEYDGVLYFRSRITGWNIVKDIKFLKEYLVVDSIKKTLLKNWRRDYRLIHAHSSVLNGLSGFDVAHKKGIPFIYEIRALWEDAAVNRGKTKEDSLRYRFTRKIETALLRKADKVIVICEGLKKDIVERGIPEDKVKVIPNGVDVESFKPIAMDKEIAGRYSLNGAKVIGFIGTFFRFEGIDLMIESIPYIVREAPDARFLIVGGGEREAYLRRLVEEKGLSKRVIFTGRVRHEDIKRYYSIMDILVYPRISERITEMVTPVKPLEAMAMGKVVIGSDVGGLKELIEDKKTGLIFRSGDSADLASKCIFALNSRNLMEDIEDQARGYVLKERNWLDICKGYLDIYRELGVDGRC